MHAPYCAALRNVPPAVRTSLTPLMPRNATALIQQAIARPVHPCLHPPTRYSHSYPLLPPPSAVAHNGIGEQRMTAYTPVGISICEELDVEKVLLYSCTTCM